MENYGYRDVRQSLTLTLPNTGDYDIECLVKQDGYSADIGDVVPIVVTKTGKSVSNDMESTFELCRWGRSRMNKFLPQGWFEFGRLG